MPLMRHIVIKFINKVQEMFMLVIVRKELKLEWFLLMMEKLLQLIQLF